MTRMCYVESTRLQLRASNLSQKKTQSDEHGPSQTDNQRTLDAVVESGAPAQKKKKRVFDAPGREGRVYQNVKE